MRKIAFTVGKNEHLLLDIVDFCRKNGIKSYGFIAYEEILYRLKAKGLNKLTYNMRLCEEELIWESDSYDPSYQMVLSLNAFKAFFDKWVYIKIKNTKVFSKIKNVLVESGYKMNDNEDIKNDFFVNLLTKNITFIKPDTMVKEMSLFDLLKLTMSEIDEQIFNRISERIHIDNELAA